MKFPGEKKSTLCIYTDSMATEKLASNAFSRTSPATAAAAAALVIAPSLPPPSHAPSAASAVAASEAAALRKELETARAALRRQEARCRSLAAALGAKVRRREEAVAAERRLRDRQLAAVLRALAHLEQRLRAEQRLIRRQLAERDATIQAQAEELRRLRSAEEERPERFRWPADAPEDSPAPPRVLTRGPPPTAVVPPSSSSVAASAAAGSHRYALTPRAPRPTRSKSASHLPCGTTKHQQQQQQHSPPLTTAARRATTHIESESEATLLRFRPHLPTGVTTVAANGTELDCGTLDSDSGVFHGSDGSDSSLRSDEAPTRGGDAPVTPNTCCDYDPYDDLSSPPARDLAKHYEHNPVLECVSQILLQDRCDDGGGGSSPPEPPPPLAPSQGGGGGGSSGRRRAPPPPALWPSIREERESVADDSADVEETHSEASRPPPSSPSAPARAQHLQERACALLTRRLTVASHPDLEQVDAAADTTPPPPSPPNTLLSDSSLPPATPPRAALPGGASTQSAPPAVPPKPPQLGAMGRLRRRPPARSPPIVASRSPVPAPAPAHQPPTPGPAMRPHRQILSNGSLLKAAAAAAASASAGSVNGVTPSSSPESDNSAVAMACDRGASVTRVRGVGPVAARVQRQLEQQQQQQRSGSAANGVGAASTIRVGSSVSSLITGAAGGSIVNELTRDRHPDSLHSHFEEFRLEDVDIGDPERSSGDGGAYPISPSSHSTASSSPSPTHNSPPHVALVVVPAAATATVAASTASSTGSSAGSTTSCDDAGTYEGFLEATGLSQKPLLTPSRLLSNHRSMLKPKDVKLRSRAARAVSAGAGAPPPDRPPPVVRYWVEPFL